MELLLELVLKVSNGEMALIEYATGLLVADISYSSLVNLSQQAQYPI